MPNPTPAPARAPSAAAPDAWYRIHAHGQPGAPQGLAGNEAEVLIFGDIGDDWWEEESNTAISLIEQLNALPDEVQYITVRINSYGGRVSDGLAIHNALRRHPAQVSVSVEGVAVSIASLIAMAGDTVEMAANSLLMIHAPWTGAVGNSADMRRTADMLDTYADAMASSYARKTGGSRDDMAALLKDGEDHWYTAEQALAAGLIDEITDELAAVASARMTHRFTPPAAMADRINLNLEATMPNRNRDTHHSDPQAGGAQQPATTPQPSGQEPAASTPPTQGDNNGSNVSAAYMRQRNEAIVASFRGFLSHDGVAELQTECLADPEVTAEQANAKLLAKLAEGAEPVNPQNAGPRVSDVVDQREKARAGMSEAILMRMGHGRDAQPNNEFRGLRLHEMARACLSDVGVDARGMSPLELAEASLSRMAPRGAQTTSDFPVILEDVMHKMVLTGYNAQPDSWTAFCREGTVSDFRDHKRLRTGVVGNINEVNEAGEYKNIHLPDAEAERIAAKRRGAIISITPEIIVNDDLGEVSRMADGLGRSAQRTIESAVFKLLNANPTLADGKDLFHADHGNLAGSGAVPSVETLDAARIAMGKQTDITGKEYLDITPAVWVGPLSQGGNVRVIVRAEYDPDTANKLQKPNKVNGIVQTIVDSPRVNGNGWYLFADPNIAPVIEVVFLDGERQPRMAMEENFRTAGLSWRVELPFGVAPVDFRGAYKNPGNG